MTEQKRTLDDIRDDWDTDGESPTVVDWMWEMAEDWARIDIPLLLAALAEKDEEIEVYETTLSAGQMIVCRQNATIGNLHEDLAEKDAEIERLKAAAERFSRKIAGLPE